MSTKKATDFLVKSLSKGGPGSGPRPKGGSAENGTVPAPVPPPPVVKPVPRQATPAAPKPGATFGSAYGAGASIGAGAGESGGAAAPQAGAASRATAGTMNRVAGKSNGCDGCDSGKCDHPEHVEKAITSRSLVVPFHMRAGVAAKYDKHTTERSATQQTSRMYTALAPPVRATLDHLINQEKADPRLNVAIRDAKRSEAVQKLRHEMAVKASETRRDPRWNK